MEKVYELVINGQNWLLVDKVESGGFNYFCAVLLDSKKEMTSKYAIFKKIEKDGKESLDLIRSEEEMSQVLNSLISKISREIYDTLPKAGSTIEFREQNYIILSYIPYNNNIYMILVTNSKPIDIVVAKIEEDDNGEMGLIDVTYLDDAVKVLQIHSVVYGDKQ